ncbi:MAG: hypothetical protein WCK59_02025 [Candidatus Falkowbacteria bacterium]
MNSKNLSAKDAITIDSGLDWIGRIFNPELFNNIWEKKNKDGHYISTLRAYRQDFDHHLEAHSSREQITELKKAIDNFIETNEVFQRKSGLMHHVQNYYLRKRANVVYKKTHEILKHLKKDPAN